MRMHKQTHFLRSYGVDRRRIGPQKMICRSGLFRFFANELDGVVGEDAEIAVLVEGVQERPLYAGFEEFL